MDESIQLQTDRLQDLQIRFEVIPNQEMELERRWEEAFAKDLSKSQKRKMAFKQCMWNVFSWEKINCLKERRAIEAFDHQKKAGCVLIYASNEQAIYIPKAGRLKAKDIIHTSSPGRDAASDFDDSFVKYLEDLYIVDEEFTWTYVLTHEEYCGPYFYKT